MSAKDMFEKLDYHLVKNDIDYMIVYEKGKHFDDRQNYKAIPKEIKFFKDIREIDFKYGRLGSYLYFELIQAINKQVEELGWLEEVEE